jgi:hypothetical protein
VNRGNGGTTEGELVFRGGGERALFIVEAGDLARAKRLLAYFDGMACEVRPIAVGPVVVCAAWVEQPGSGTFESMAEHLRDGYSLSICEPGFSPSMYRVALQLARDTEGELRPLECCSVCGAPDPFPTTLSLRVGGEEARFLFCQSCSGAVMDAPDAVARLLLGKAAERSPEWRDVELGPPMKSGRAWRFPIRRAADALSPSHR